VVKAPARWPLKDEKGSANKTPVAADNGMPSVAVDMTCCLWQVLWRRQRLKEI
jgi:hypothetical protein